MRRSDGWGVWGPWIGFAVLAALVALGRLDAIDAWLGARLRGPDAPWLAVTRWGDTGVLAGATVVTAAWLWRDRGSLPAARMLAVAGLGWLLSRGLKLLFARPRPEGGAIDVASHAFPSGHALGSLVVFLAWARLAAPEQRGLHRLALAAALLVGASRVALGVHHVSDVVGGWLLGWGLVTAVCPPPSTRPAQDAAPRPEG